MWLGHGDMGTTANIYAHLDVSVKRNMADTLAAKFSSFEKTSEAELEICATTEPPNAE